MLTHLDHSGAASMVDVGQKPPMKRQAVAIGFIKLQPDTLKLVKAGGSKKGDVLACARIAGISAAKRTSELIPLCHNLFIEKVGVEFELTDEGIAIEATARCTAKTGIEMEALTAVSVAALTIYDMCKAVDKQMEIGRIVLKEKTKQDLG